MSEKLNTEYCSREDLKRVFINSYDAIFVTDGAGTVLLCNPATGKMLDTDPQELIGENTRDLVNRGVYDRSIAQEALESGEVVTGIIKNRHDIKILSTATPIYDEKGHIIIVIVNSRDIKLVEKCFKTIDRESNKAVRYKTAAEYLSDRQPGQQAVIAKSKKMREILETSTFIAKSDSTVILFGESGTGKEVIAKFIHRNSHRSHEPFIPVNCAAIPSELLESEFFGYVAGAFTGANSRGKSGLFEIAHKGTIFLDEVAELPLTMQSKLLRVIETGEIQRLGSTNIIRTNIRLIAATNRDLYAMVKEKQFRSDLYYRLNVIPINLPPLRERPEDILALAQKFLEDFNKKYRLKKVFTQRALRGLLSYSWPGNVRELRNIIERRVVTSACNQIDFEDDMLISKKLSVSEDIVALPDKNRLYRGTLKSVLKKVESEYIDQVLEECNGRIGEAANRLGIHRTMLYRKMNSVN